MFSNYIAFLFDDLIFSTSFLTAGVARYGPVDDEGNLRSGPQGKHIMSPGSLAGFGGGSLGWRPASAGAASGQPNAQHVVKFGERLIKIGAEHV